MYSVFHGMKEINLIKHLFLYKLVIAVQNVWNIVVHYTVWDCFMSPVSSEEIKIFQST